MRRDGKHPALESFLSLFTHIRECADNDPGHLEQSASNDKQLEQGCVDLWEAARELEDAERTSREMFAKTVDETFIEYWREYNERWVSAVAGVLLKGIDFSGLEPDRREKSKRDFENADQEAMEAAQGIRAALRFAGDQINEEWKEFPDGFASNVEDGLLQWRYLLRTVGFDLRGVFRRRLLVPFVLIPRHISDRYGQNEPDSIFTLLQQAHEAFIYGVPYAAVALMRRVVETVLREHYDVSQPDPEKKSDLIDLIDKASLPKNVSRRDLHDIRMLANEVLHGANAVAKLNSASGQVEFELRLVGHLQVVRDLIEGHKRSAAIRAFRPHARAQ